MTKDQFGLLLVGAVGLGWALGVLAGAYTESESAAAGVASGVPIALGIAGASPISRAWWSVNRQEAAAPDFRREATQSLRLVMFVCAGLAVLLGGLALSKESIYWAAFAGSLLALAAFTALRLRDISARKFL